jgi:hypothetical protein
MQQQTRSSDRKRRSVGLALAAGVALMLAGCESATGASDVTMVELVQSFGFCPPDAYCTTRLRVADQQAVVTLESRSGQSLESRTELSASDADSLAETAASTRFEGVGPVIGCPDCADGGAESLSVTADGETRTVTFEYAARVAELEPLLGQMRSLLARTRPMP